jgi:hypothetical protein
MSNVIGMARISERQFHREHGTAIRPIRRMDPSMVGLDNELAEVQTQSPSDSPVLATIMLEEHFENMRKLTGIDSRTFIFH